MDTLSHEYPVIGPDVIGQSADILVAAGWLTRTTHQRGRPGCTLTQWTPQHPPQPSLPDLAALLTTRLHQGEWTHELPVEERLARGLHVPVEAVHHAYEHLARTGEINKVWDAHLAHTAGSSPIPARPVSQPAREPLAEFTRPGLDRATRSNNTNTLPAPAANTLHSPAVDRTRRSVDRRVVSRHGMGHGAGRRRRVLV